MAVSNKIDEADTVTGAFELAPGCWSAQPVGTQTRDNLTIEESEAEDPGTQKPGCFRADPYNMLTYMRSQAEVGHPRGDLMAASENNKQHGGATAMRII